MLKETFKFWASGYHIKGPLPPSPHTQDTVTKSCVRQVRTGESVKLQVLFFLPRGGRISTAKVSYDLGFRIFGTFYGISQKDIIVEGKSWNKKNIEKTLNMNMVF